MLVALRIRRTLLLWTVNALKHDFYEEKEKQGTSDNKKETMIERKLAEKRIC